MVHDAATALAARDRRSLDNFIVDLVRRAAHEANDSLLSESIAQEDRGEVIPLRPEALAALRREIKAGTSAEQALTRAGL